VDNLNTLPEQTDQQRLVAYKAIIAACTHTFSKNKLQVDKMKDALRAFYPLAKTDPLFACKLAAWSASDKNESRDLKLISIYTNSLSDADGSLFTIGGTIRKPNLRQVSAALLSSLNPKELFRLAYLRKLKWSPNGQIEAQHFPNSLRTAIRQYLESLPASALKAHVKAGFSRHLISTFRLVHAQPTAQQAIILRWQQQEKRGLNVEVAAAENPFKGLSDKKIAQKIVNEKFKFRQALSLLEKEPNLTVLEALLEVGSPNELLVQTSLFDKGGLLAVPELAEKFYAKLAQAKSADRLDTIKFETTEGVKERLAESRAKSRQAQFGQLDGELWMDVDKSGSMKIAIDQAKESAATVCEIVGAENFFWGLIGSGGTVLTDKPTTKEKAMSILYLHQANDSNTDCFANLRGAMQKRNIKYWMILTDGGHNLGSTDLSKMKKPDAAIIVKLGNYTHDLEGHLQKNKIPFAAHDPSILKSSNLVVQSLKAILKGETAIIEEIMSTNLARYGVNL